MAVLRVNLHIAGSALIISQVLLLADMQAEAVDFTLGGIHL
ncbi:hypothetical protein [Malonomonas rubra]|nr:hypothetical protein [Malonomonas rubra]